MSDAAQPTAAEVRAAAEAVKTALDRHLAAVERRSGEDDPAVYEAFNELAAAAEEYDELLYDRYDEVTPFEIPGSDSDVLPPYQGPEEANALSVLIRRDYAVAEPQRLLAQAQRVADLDEGTAGESPAAAAAGSSVHAALGVLFGEFEPDEIASRHKEFGLEEGDSTLWVTAADEPAEPGSGSTPPSTRRTRTGSCAASTSARSSTTSRTTTASTPTSMSMRIRTPWRCWRSSTSSTKRTTPTSPTSPTSTTTEGRWTRIADLRGAAVAAAPRRSCASGCPAHAVAGTWGRSRVCRRVVRAFAGISATARGSACSAPWTTDRCRSPRLNAV